VINPGAQRPAAPEEALRLLSEGHLKVLGLMPDCSNYTFLVRATADGRQALAVYKPQRGEAPLADFPYGTLCKRERAAYLLSEALGWELVPLTITRAGAPIGFGSLQLFIEADPNEHYFTLAPGRRDVFLRFALFDWVINNADRKSGHCLLDAAGHIWGINHGLSFHTLPNLRTVIWDFAGERVSRPLLTEICALLPRLDGSEGWAVELRTLLDPAEIAALGRRVRAIEAAGVFPQARSQRSYPWPPI